MKVSQKNKTEITCGIYLYDTLINKFLICHATHSRWNKWTIPKGLKNAGEDILAAASRELREETGIDLSKVNVQKIFRLPDVKYKKRNKVLISFLVITDSDFSHHIFKCSSTVDHRFPEIDNWKWMDPQNEEFEIHKSQQENLAEIKGLLEPYRQSHNNVVI